MIARIWRITIFDEGGYIKNKRSKNALQGPASWLRDESFFNFLVIETVQVEMDYR